MPVARAARAVGGARARLDAGARLALRAAARHGHRRRPSAAAQRSLRASMNGGGTAALAVGGRGADAAGDGPAGRQSSTCVRSARGARRAGRPRGGPGRRGRARRRPARPRHSAQPGAPGASSASEPAAEPARTRGWSGSGPRRERRASAAQGRAVEKQSSAPRRRPGPALLLHGVTGSSKTEVCLRAVAAVSAGVAPPIVSCPRSPSPHDGGPFRQTGFGDAVASCASRLSRRERYDE